VNGIDNLGYETDPPPVATVDSGPKQPLEEAPGGIVSSVSLDVDGGFTVTGSRMDPEISARRKMTRAKLTPEQQDEKLRGGHLVRMLAEAMAKGDGSTMDWAFQKPAYQFSTYRTNLAGLFAEEAVEFSRGVKDGAIDGVMFIIHLFPFTGHDSWEDIDNSLQTISLISNSYQDTWWGDNSVQSQAVVGQFEAQIAAIDLNSSYTWGTIAGGLLADRLGTGFLSKAKKYDLGILKSKYQPVTKGGGAYYTKYFKVPSGYDRHHMPSKVAYRGTNVSSNRGGAIRMTKVDHRLTASYGKISGILYRAKQKRLVHQGKFRQAFYMDVKDLMSLKDDSGMSLYNKYSAEIDEVIQYYRREQFPGF
jgi:hypothetical protein